MKAVNTAGEAKADSMLDVMGKPKPPKVVKEIEPAEVVIPGKRDIKLNCKIAGFPAPTIKWYRDGNEIKVRYCVEDEIYWRGINESDPPTDVLLFTSHL